MFHADPSRPDVHRDQEAEIAFRNSQFQTRNPQSAIRNGRAFSLVEMLVVIGIIGLLLSIVLIVGRGALNDAKVKDTRVMLSQLNSAIQSFADADPYKSVQRAKVRYGPYPPDSIRCFEPTPATPSPDPYLLTGGGGRFAKIGASGPYTDDYDPAIPPDPNYIADSGIKTLVFFLRSQSASREIYDAIPDRFRVTVPAGDNAGNEYFDFNNNAMFDPTIDKEVQYLVDGWKHAIEYYSVRQLDPSENPPTSHAWVAQKLVQANKNLPVLVSYGLDGDVQFKQGQTLEAPYNDSSVGSGELFFASPLHEDNVYLDDSLRDKMKLIKKD